MSGGSMGYLYSSVQDYCVGYMQDAELDDLMKDLVKVLHDLEWFQDCDIGEEDYRNTVTKFKNKWFKADRNERLKGYIDEKIEKTKKELYNLIGEK